MDFVEPTKEADCTQPPFVGVDRFRRFSISAFSREETEILRKKLKLQLEHVEDLSVKIAARQEQLLKEIAQSGQAHLSRTENGGSTPSLVLSTDRLLGRRCVAGKEKRTPKANVLFFNSEFVSGKDTMPPPEKLNPKAEMGTKRGVPGKVDARDAKRAKVEFSHSKQMANIMKQSGTLLQKLISHKHAWVFNEPVDVFKLGLDDYFQFIKKPMDLGTVKQNLDSGTYTQPQEIADDIRLTFSNAMMYNPRGHYVYVMAEVLSDLFEKHWKDIEDNIDEDRLKVELKEDTRAARAQGQIKHYQDLQTKLTNLENKLQALETRHTGARRPPAQPKPRPDDSDKRLMTFDEKRKLSFALENLPSHKHERMLEIIRKRDTIVSSNEDEVEIEISSFDNETLWELDRYVTNWAKSKGKFQQKAPPKLPKEPASQPNQSSSQFSSNSRGENPKKLKNGVEFEDEDVDIDDDVPPLEYEPVVIDKDASGSSSSSGSSSDSNSSSSDSGSSSSSGSDSDSDSVSSSCSNFDAEESRNENTSKGSRTLEPEAPNTERRKVGESGETV